MPDNEVLNLSERLENISKIFEVTTKPLIMDIDTGGQLEHLKLMLSLLSEQEYLRLLWKIKLD